MPGYRQHLAISFVAILVLRLLVGFHFYSEGISKVKKGDFDCEPFLQQAKGPLADFYHGLIDDYQGRIRLCVTPVSTNHDAPLKIDTSLTLAIWEDFVERSVDRFQFDESQLKAANSILTNSRTHLESLLMGNEEEILVWAAQASRLNGFERDGDYRKPAAAGVASLNEQIATIKNERAKKASSWLSEIERVWDELETGINQLHDPAIGLDNQVQLPRPYRERWSPQTIINRFLPLFDCVVGGMLIIGLFSRVAALAGIGLLLGVVCTQPPWIMGVQNTFYQWIEIAALFVLFAFCAGKFGGLDYFIGSRRDRGDRSETDE